MSTSAFVLSGWLLTVGLVSSAALGADRTVPDAIKPVAGNATRAGVEKRLRATELPPSEEELRALGDHPDVALVLVASDEKLEILIRARAVMAMTNAQSPSSRRFLETVVETRSGATAAPELLLLRKAALALGWFGGPAVPPQLAPLLTHPDPDVRLDGAIGLGLTRLKSAAELLRKRVPAETDSRVRRQIGRQLRSIEQALAPS